MITSTFETELGVRFSFSGVDAVTITTKNSGGFIIQILETVDVLAKKLPLATFFEFHPNGETA